MIAAPSCILNEFEDEQYIAHKLSVANVNPATGFTTNYLNHYVEILLLLEILPDMPDCIYNIREWKPVSYRDYILKGGLSHCEIILKAYEAVDPDRKANLNAVSSAADQQITSLIERVEQVISVNDQKGLIDISGEAKKCLTTHIEALNRAIMSGYSSQGDLALS